MNMTQVIYSLLKNYNNFYEIDDELINKLSEYYNFNNKEFRNKLYKTYQEKERIKKEKLLKIKQSLNNI